MSIGRRLPHAVSKGKRQIPQNTKIVLWRNVSALMRDRWGKENLTKLSREAGIGPASCSRIKEQQTSVGLEVLEAVARAFNVHPWQLLVPNLDPSNPPSFIMSDEERSFYERVRNVMAEFSTHAPPHIYGSSNGVRTYVERRIAGRRATDRH